LAPQIVKVLAVTRERLRKRFSEAGINSLISKYGDRR
jgi:hypothetical protein